MPPILDKAQFDSLVCGDVAIFSQILDDYESNSSSLIQSLVEGLSDASAKGALHQFKGSSGMLGFAALYQLCAELEAQQPCQIDAEQIENLRGLFVDSVASARAYLEEIAG